MGKEIADAGQDEHDSQAQQSSVEACFPREIATHLYFHGLGFLRREGICREKSPKDRDRSGTVQGRRKGIHGLGRWRILDVENRDRQRLPDSGSPASARKAS
jgi:hypothetical protein